MPKTIAEINEKIRQGKAVVVTAEEMIDVVEVTYRVVQVEQQKYVCRCGGCVETAPGPERATPGSRDQGYSRVP